MNIDPAEEIKKQRSEVFRNDFRVNLHDACGLGSGIIRLTQEEKIECLSYFDEAAVQPSFFIPASGSGSRMFQFLYEWLEGNGSNDKVDELFEKLDVLALYRYLESPISDKRAIVKELISKFSQKPKGLIPFHANEGLVRTAFQEHAEQVQELSGKNAVIHFTVQSDCESEIRENILSLEGGADLNLSFSHQESSSNAYCFLDNEELAIEDGEPIRRPAGHGALLDNLNKIESDLVLIKNIDNIQHSEKSKQSIETWKEVTAVLLKAKQGIADLTQNYTEEGLSALNKRFQFLSEQEEQEMTEERFKSVANRPTRVCGMVVNKGEPGGGPFWINDNGQVSKHIIEKVQIDDTQLAQQKILEKSSHFNPVLLAVSKSNVFGDPLDLMQYRDDSKYFVVNKSQNGLPIKYRELPGLWNGSMSNWNTIFLEIPLEVFSPVKTVLDLAKPAHQPA